MDVLYVLIDEILPDLVKMVLVLDTENDDRRVCVQLFEIKGVGRLDASVTGLHGPLRNRQVFTDKNINVRMFLPHDASLL